MAIRLVRRGFAIRPRDKRPGVSRWDVKRLGSMLGAVLMGTSLPLGGMQQAIAQPAQSTPTIDEVVDCEVLIVGGGLSGTAAAYESLRSGRTVCMTEITDWVGGQISSQGTSALDEASKQRSLLYYPEGYNQLRRTIEAIHGELNPGDCWVSLSCFLPADAHTILSNMLEEAANQGGGQLKWFPATVVKELEISADGRMIDSAIAIQHAPQPGTPLLNASLLSETFLDSYQYEDSERLTKHIVQFVPAVGDGADTGDQTSDLPKADWYVVEATETGEIIALSGVPYRLGLDPRSHLNPSSPTETADPYCTQGFTYTFAMERMAAPQPQSEPTYYEQYEPYFSYERSRPDNDYFDYVFTYRRIAAPDPRPETSQFGVSAVVPGDISMQNWTWGNDYRPGTAKDNLIFSADQLAATGQLEAGGWLGGLRVDALRKAEENAFSYYYWLVEGDTDSQLGPDVKTPAPNHRFLSGFDSPMGTAHGLSKYPYMREARRIIGRPSTTYPDGFSVSEVDISKVDYRDDYYRETLGDRRYLSLWQTLAGLEAASVIANEVPAEDIERRSRSTIYPDAVGIAQYAIDFHPCMAEYPFETPGNTERANVRRAHGQAYPAQIPLRAMIPQKIDNLLIAGKTIATSNIAAAAYRVHSFEWSVGVAAGATIDFALDNNLMPYELTDQLPAYEPELEKLQKRLNADGNPTAFPDTSIFNLDWEEWRVW